MKRLTKITKKNLRQVRHNRVRSRVKGTAVVPRLSVFRGNRVVNAQLVDDEAAKTLCAVSSRAIKPSAVEGKGAKVALAYLVGQELAAKAKAINVVKVVFDRGGYRYHGRVAAVAEGARNGGF